MWGEEGTTDMARRHRFAKATAPVAPTIPVILPSPTAAPSVQRVPTTSAAQATEVSAFAEIGATGLKQFSGYLKEEFIRDLIDRTGRARFHEMLTNHPMIKAGLGTINLHLRQIPIHVEAGGDSIEDKKAAMLIETSLDDMALSRSDTFSNLLTMLPYGWSLSETVYKRRLGSEPGETTDETGQVVALPTSSYNDGLIGWRKWAARSQQSLVRWDFAPDGGTRGMYQQAAPDYRTRYLPLNKCLLFRTSAINDNPEGDSLLRGCYTSWYTQKQLLFIQAVGFKRDLTGIPIAYLPQEIMTAASGTAEASVRDECEKIVKRLVVDEQAGVAWPAIFDSNGNQVSKLELIGSPGSKQANVKEAIEYYDTRIAQVLFTDFLLFGHTKIGTQALSSTRIEDVYMLALTAWLESILEVINRRAIPQLLALNGMRPQQMPKLAHGRVGNPDLTMIGQYITALAGAGMMLFPSPEGDLESLLLDMADLPAAKRVAKRASRRVRKHTVTPRAEPTAATFSEMGTVLVDAARELRDELRKLRRAA